VNPLPLMDFNFDPSLIFTFNTNICFSNNSTGAISYFWDFDFNGPTSFSTLVSPCPVLFPEENGGSYEVKLIGINQFGCIDSISKTITIEDDFIVYIPNSFTPNNDLVNDEISVLHQGVESLEWIIFNRWGEEIFHSTDLNKSWNGFHKNEFAPTGSYPYRLLVTSKTGRKKEFIGQINLLK
jgi:gliding motility-associated-like protein